MTPIKLGDTVRIRGRNIVGVVSGQFYDRGERFIVKSGESLYRPLTSQVERLYVPRPHKPQERKERDPRIAALAKANGVSYRFAERVLRET